MTDKALREAAEEIVRVVDLHRLHRIVNVSRLRAALAAIADKTWEPAYCPKCGDTVLVCPDCVTADAPEGPSDPAKVAFVKAHAAVEGEWLPSDKWEEALDAGLRAAYVIDRLHAQQENK